MEINRQLFEDVLSGKLKGTFVLRNGITYFSANLYQNYNKYRFTHPYMIGFGSYTPKGIFSIDDTTSRLDIVNFIPDTNMKKDELIIEIPNGMCIDESKSTFEKIVFKKKDTKPRSWKEYLELNTGFDGAGIDWNCGGVQTTGLHHRGKAIVPTNLAAPFIAMMQLMSLRQAWIDDWKPNWKNGGTEKWCIMFQEDELTVDYFYTTAKALSFPTKEMAEDFMNCFKDLLNVAKPLI